MNFTKGVAEMLLNLRGEYTEEILTEIGHCLSVDILQSISKGNFKEYGRLLYYKLDKNLLNDYMRTEVKCENYNMELKFLVVKDGNEVYIQGVYDIDKDRPIIYTSEVYAYVYKNIVYMPDYNGIEYVSNGFKKNDYIFANDLHLKMSKHFYSKILNFYERLMNEEDFETVVVEGTKEKQLLCNVFEINVFKTDLKDKIVVELSKNLLDGGYRNTTRNISNYVNNKDKCIDEYIDNNSLLIKTSLIKFHREALISRNKELKKELRKTNKKKTNTCSKPNSLNKISRNEAKVSNKDECCYDMDGYNENNLMPKKGQKLEQKEDKLGKAKPPVPISNMERLEGLCKEYNRLITFAAATINGSLRYLRDDFAMVTVDFRARLFVGKPIIKEIKIDCSNGSFVSLNALGVEEYRGKDKIFFLLSFNEEKQFEIYDNDKMICRLSKDFFSKMKKINAELNSLLKIK